jgi:hypothetical protein
MKTANGSIPAQHEAIDDLSRLTPESASPDRILTKLPFQTAPSVTGWAHGTKRDDPMPGVGGARATESVAMFKTMARLAFGILGATLLACSTSTAPDGPMVDGTYVLQSVSGRGPSMGTLRLTRQGYAERRVRFQESDGSLSREYLARGTVVVLADSTLELELKEMDIMASEPWHPESRLVNGAVEIRHPDPDYGPDIVETYVRQ